MAAHVLVINEFTLFSDFSFFHNYLFLSYHQPLSDQVGAILHDWLDIDLYVSEECLHLAVSTPIRPDGTQNPSMPVMFFVHGGAFYGGTQIRMGAERLGAWDDVVVVAINYRVVVSNYLDITL